MNKASDDKQRFRAGSLQLTQMILFILLFVPVIVYGKDTVTEEGQKGEWTVIAGAGGKLETDYSENEIEAIPVVIVRYETAHQEYFLSVLDGIGVSSDLLFLPVEFEMAAEFGEQREAYHSGNNSEPAVRSPVTFSAGVSMPFLFGSVFTGIEYFPGRKEYTDGRKFYVHPLTFSAGWGFEKEMIPVIFSLEASAVFMNRTYADTYYSALQTEDFLAGAGFESLRISMQLYLFFSEHTGLGFTGEGNYYPDKLIDSPFIATNFSTEAALAVFYLF